MNTEQAYNRWSNIYDSNINKTRDLEAVAFRENLAGKTYKNALEIGCGTGKNTVWLAENVEMVTGADFSAEMLGKAKAKVAAQNVRFVQLDVRENWPFPENSFDLVSCSLILEHIEDLDFVFQQAHQTLAPGAIFYLGELHPFKQYQGSKARFEAENGATEVLECFTHHVSDFFAAGAKNGFEAVAIGEWFDHGERANVPRILTMKFRRKN